MGDGELRCYEDLLDYDAIYFLFAEVSLVKKKKHIFVICFCPQDFGRIYRKNWKIEFGFV